MSADAEPIAMSIKDAVAHTGLSRSKIYEMLKSKDLASVSVGSRRLVLTNSIREFFNRISGVQK